MSKDEFPRSSDTILSNSYMITSKTDKILTMVDLRLRDGSCPDKTKVRNKGLTERDL